MTLAAKSKGSVRSFMLKIEVKRMFAGSVFPEVGRKGWNSLLQGKQNLFFRYFFRKAEEGKGIQL
jgi:hypothetical protein